MGKRKRIPNWKVQMATEETLGKAHRGKKAQSVVLQENSQVETELNNPEKPPKITTEISELEASEHQVEVVHTSASSSKLFSSNSGVKSWADQVEAEIPISKASIRDNFNISKVSNIGFKLVMWLLRCKVKSLSL